MALSNWDTLAFDENGEFSEGTLNGPNGSSVSFYKNWLYVHDPEMWAAGRKKWTEPTIAKINDGHIYISDFEIKATRHTEQDAIFALIECYKTKTAMSGIACYGYDDESWIGVSEQTQEAFYLWLKDVVESSFLLKSNYYNRCKRGSGRRFNQGDKFITEKLGIDVDISTKVGKSDDPLFMKLIKG